MPTFQDPVVDGEERRHASRALAHATRTFDDPAQTYEVVGDLLGGSDDRSNTVPISSRSRTPARTRSLGLTTAITRARVAGSSMQPVAAPARACPRRPDPQAGVDERRSARRPGASYQVSWELHRAAEMIHQVADGVDRAHEIEATIAYDIRDFPSLAPVRPARREPRDVAVTGGRTGGCTRRARRPGRERRQDREAPQGSRASARWPRTARPARTEAKREGRRARGRAARDRRTAPRRRARPRRAAHPRAAAAPAPPGHLRDPRRRVPVPRRRRTRQRGRLRRPGPLLRQLVRLRPVGALRPRPDHRAEPRPRRHRRLRQVLRSPRASTRARSRSAAASTCPATRRASTPPSPKRSAGRRSRSGTAWRTDSTRSTRATAPPALDDAQWAGQVASRRRDLVGALAETVLDRRLSPLEHTAIDIALADTVRASDVPDPADGRRPAPRPRPSSTTPTAASPRTAGSSGTPSVGSSPATSPGCSTARRTVTFDPTLPMISLDLSRVTENATLDLGPDDLRVGVDGVRAPRPRTAGSAGSCTTKPGGSCRTPRCCGGWTPTGGSRATTGSRTC